MGYTILNAIESLKDAGTLVHSHHENFDGSGYPNRLKKAKIPLGARIIRVANDYDHLINRKGISLNNAQQKLKNKSN